MKSAVIIASLTLALGASAALTITEPSAAHWWIAQSVNTLAWSGSDPSQFSVFLSNPNQNVLTSMLALTSITYAYDTSKTINPGNITPATGYTILLTNPLNSSDVYATSESFEIKAVNSAYPPQGSPSGAAASSAITVSNTASPSGSSASASASPSGGSSAGSATAHARCGLVTVLAGGAATLALF
ncbi:hypothetical protein IAU60_004137 [Kwoniella sp. DSM 27419]